MHNISHKKPVPDLKVVSCDGCNHILVAIAYGENMEPISYKFTTVTGLKSSLDGIAECHWAV